MRINSKPASIPALAASTLGLWSHLQVDRYSVLGAIVVDQRAHVGQTDDVGLGVAQLREHGSALAPAARTMARSVSWLSTLNAPTAKRTARQRFHQLSGTLDVAAHRGDMTTTAGRFLPWLCELDFGGHAVINVPRLLTELAKTPIRPKAAMAQRPIIVFDVNETLLDLDTSSTL